MPWCFERMEYGFHSRTHPRCITYLGVTIVALVLWYEQRDDGDSVKYNMGLRFQRSKREIFFSLFLPLHLEKVKLYLRVFARERDV